jgi:ABC-type glycerol-3-phosphate transport system substrate-binding protein
MMKLLTLTILGVAILGLAACAHHDDAQNTQSSSASTGYKK